MPRDRERRRPLRLEQLEQRALLNATAVFDHVVFHPAAGGAGVPPPASSISGFSPSQIQSAYGVNVLAGEGGNGSGQTIAIVDAYDDPNIFSDAAAFNTQFGLPQFNVSGGPTLSVLNQTGGTSLPGSGARTGDAEVEESLDVEWAHAIAPQANIILFEANSLSMSNLMTAVEHGRGLFRRLRGFDELGQQRILRRDFGRLVFHHAQRSRERDISGVDGRQRCAGRLSGLFTQRRRRRRHVAVSQLQQRYLQCETAWSWNST